MKKAAIYARYSSDSQREESIDAQIRACKFYANKFDLEIVATYVDRAKSGMTTRKRSEFLRMMEDSTKDRFEVVLVHKLNRFGRNALELLENKGRLEHNNVELVSVTEKLDSSPEGKLLLMVMTGINEFYSANLAQEVMKGLMENAYQGKHTGGRPPLGYDVGSDMKYIINEREATAVRLIFQMYADGSGYGKIIDFLNGRGYRTKRNDTFGKNSLHDILKNEKYCGVFTFNKSPHPDADGKQKSRHQAKANYVRIEDGCPAIVSRELFERVQKMMELNKHCGAEHKAKVLYLLSGKLYCGLCGGKMVGENRRSKGVDYYYYVCNTAKRKKDCPQLAIRKEEVERQVIERLNRMAFSESFIDDVVEKMYGSYDESVIDIENVHIQIQDITNQIQNLLKLAARGLEIDDLFQQIESLKEQRSSLEQSVAALQAMPDNRKSKEELRKHLVQFCQFVKLSPELQKKAIQFYVDRIYAHKDKNSNAVKIDVIINPNGVVDIMAGADRDPKYPQYLFGQDGILILQIESLNSKTKNRRPL